MLPRYIAGYVSNWATAIGVHERIAAKREESTKRGKLVKEKREEERRRGMLAKAEIKKNRMQTEDTDKLSSLAYVGLNGGSEGKELSGTSGGGESKEAGDPTTKSNSTIVPCKNSGAQKEEQEELKRKPEVGERNYQPRVKRIKEKAQKRLNP
ncbi:unnamed protein product [Blepharisma stoltei]|uniref:Uncharacterized protein n=1 Tax=Blepharisma stoltei TaxID=1481888 RepID=A0AAU9IFG4_9CILI|nr:unnamed protein product [Blepharisma stoltei]